MAQPSPDDFDLGTGVAEPMPEDAEVSMSTHFGDRGAILARSLLAAGGVMVTDCVSSKLSCSEAWSVGFEFF